MHERVAPRHSVEPFCRRHKLPLRAVLSLTLITLLPACGQNVWKSSGHSATTADQIQILTKIPARYERLGTVTHLYVDGSPWQEGADATAILQDLLTESGTMGANALLLVDDTTMADTTIVMSYQGKAYALPVIGRSKTVLGQAVFVIKE